MRFMLVEITHHLATSFKDCHIKNPCSISSCASFNLKIFSKNALLLIVDIDKGAHRKANFLEKSCPGMN